MAEQLSVEFHDEMLNINEPHAYDESIQSMQFYEPDIL